MLVLILSLIFSATSANVVESLIQDAFAPVTIPLVIRRIHLNPQEEEIYKEHIYKDGDRIRIDIEYGDETVTAFIYDGKTGYRDGRTISPEGSMETLLFGCACGYLTGMERKETIWYEGRDVIHATGRQGNEVYIDLKTLLPIKYELRGRVVIFDEYKKVDGIGNIPYSIVQSRDNEVIAITRITDTHRRTSLPSNFFSVPKQDVESFD